MVSFQRTRQSSDKASGSLLEEAATLLLPFVVSLINLVVPLFYSLFKKIEHYSNPRMQVYAIIVRLEMDTKHINKYIRYRSKV